MYIRTQSPQSCLTSNMHTYKCDVLSPQHYHQRLSSPSDFSRNEGPFAFYKARHIARHVGNVFRALVVKFYGSRGKIDAFSEWTGEFNGGPGRHASDRVVF